MSSEGEAGQGRGEGSGLGGHFGIVGRQTVDRIHHDVVLFPIFQAFSIDRPADCISAVRSFMCFFVPDGSHWDG